MWVWVCGGVGGHRRQRCDKGTDLSSPDCNPSHAAQARLKKLLLPHKAPCVPAPPPPLTVLSYEPLNTFSPQRMSVRTGPWCPDSVARQVRVSASHTCGAAPPATRGQ